jgi:hypothetical protein
MLESMRSSALLVWLVASSGCSAGAPASDGPTSLTGSSKTLTVSGQYAPVAIEHIDRLAVDGGSLVLHGSSATVTVPLPPGAGQPKPGNQWVLVTEGKTEGKRTLTFTHEQSLDDFTIELPVSDADLRYGTLGGTAGGEVLVFAWGKDSRSYWGYVTIARIGGGANP